MNYFESELRKILENEYPDATFVGRACYIPLENDNRAKLYFVACGNASHYEAIQMDILNLTKGSVDTLRLHFKDVLGRKQVDNPNFQDGIFPYVWIYNDKSEWYVYKPTQADYKLLRQNISNYLAVFHSEKERQPSIDSLIQGASSRTIKPEQSSSMGDRQPDL